MCKSGSISCFSRFGLLIYMIICIHLFKDFCFGILHEYWCQKFPESGNDSVSTLKRSKSASITHRHPFHCSYLSLQRSIPTQYVDRDPHTILRTGSILGWAPKNTLALFNVPGYFLLNIRVLLHLMQNRLHSGGITDDAHTPWYRAPTLVTH